MKSFYHFPDPGPETEAQKERAHFLGLMVARARSERRERWNKRIRAVTRTFRK